MHLSRSLDVDARERERERGGGGCERRFKGIQPLTSHLSSAQHFGICDEVEMKLERATPLPQP